MPVTVTAALLSGDAPQKVQVVINGMTVGQVWSVVGSVASGYTWGIPGGSGTSDGSQVVLTDTRTALNEAITYAATVDGVTYTSSTVTVTYVDGDAVLQSLDGQTVAGVEITDMADPRQRQHRVALFYVAGRRAPVGRYDVASADAMSWALETSGDDSTAMLAMIADGGPLVRRTVTGMRDVDPVQIVQPTGSSDRLIGAVGDLRAWKLDVQRIDDPQPDVALAGLTWDDFDAAMVSRLWSPPTNQITNPGAEVSTTDWAASGTGAVLSRQTASPRTGSGFFRLTSGSTVAMSMNKSTTFAVTAGESFAAKAWVRGTVGRMVHLRMTWTGATATQATAEAVASTSTWQRITFTGTVPVGATACRPDVLVDATGMASGHILDVDDVSYARATTSVDDDFDTLFAALTWDDFDRYDWNQL